MKPLLVRWSIIKLKLIHNQIDEDGESWFPESDIRLFEYIGLSRELNILIFWKLFFVILFIVIAPIKHSTRANMQRI